MSDYLKTSWQSIGHCGTGVALIILALGVVRPQLFKEMVSRYPANKIHFNRSLKKRPSGKLKINATVPAESHGDL